MSKCTNCLSKKVCRYNDEHHLYYGYCKDGYVCPYFTNRSEWAHLPCNIGKTAYFIRNNKIIDTSVEKIVIKKTGTYLKLSCNAMYETSCKSIGKTVFFDLEEAEKALEELQ